ncbi:hypothetical protein HPB50_024944 [Hyalomma asiaticum]|uniref:Uncharacterized protein n=1 Tax=Hyalomma asiaticum TaxID=266040 RepID=A0ACB7TQ94_HYAAI|nr:hypothetical protein HPB50_024944 [Hyalomma asiaticum]
MGPQHVKATATGRGLSLSVCHPAVDSRSLSLASLSLFSRASTACRAQMKSQQFGEPEKCPSAVAVTAPPPLPSTHRSQQCLDRAVGFANRSGACGARAPLKQSYSSVDLAPAQCRRPNDVGGVIVFYKDRPASSLWLCF